jgi:8-oxo-dGTP pyrophosphatase MutT (NUDIX family)
MNKKDRQAAMAVLINKENKILIGLSTRNGGYKFPQGGLNENETPFECIKRELFEELNIIIDKTDVLETYDEKVKYHFYNVYDEFIGQEEFVFKIKFNENQKIVKNHEFGNLIWIDINDFEKYDFKYRKEAYLRALQLCKLID